MTNLVRQEAAEYTADQLLSLMGQRANVRAAEGAGTTTLSSADNKWQIFNLSAARTAVLPSANIKSGDTYRIENRGGFVLSFQSSDLTALTAANTGSGGVGDPTISRGYATLVALQDIPTAASHWKVSEVTDEGSWSTTFTFNSAGSTTTAKTIQYFRNNRFVTVVLLLGTNIETTSGAASTRFSANTSMPIQIRPPTTNPIMFCMITNAGVTSNSVGCLGIDTAGIITAKRDPTGSAWSATSLCGLTSGTLGNDLQFTYCLQ